MMMRRVVQVSVRHAKSLVVPLTRAQSVLAEPAVRLFSTTVAPSTPAFSLRQASCFSIKSLGAAPARHYAGSYPAHKVLALPALSPSMEKGTLVKWLVEVGSEIKEGNALAEVETDKAAMTWDSTESGFIAKILVPGGTKDIPIDAPLAVFVENKSDVEAFANFTFSGADAPAPAPAAAAPAPAAAAAAPVAAVAAPVAAPSAPVASGSGSSVPPVPGRRLFASPAARATASEKNVELTSVAGTGPNGRIIKNDVIAASAAVKSTPALDSVPLPTLSSASFGGAPAFTDIENSQIRKVTASRLTQSKQTIPHYYLTIDFSVDELEKIRQQLNQQSGGEFKLSINDFVIKASALALRQVPEVNSAWNETSIRRYHNVGINVAVNTDYGLFTPLIPTTDNKGLVEINKTVKELADKAKAKKLTPNDLEIGTFTISNLGMFGIKQFAAVINPPQACILAVGGLEERVVVNKAATGEHDRFKVSKFMNCTLSCDHRVVDGALGAKWLAAFRKNIENPLNMLL